MNRLTFNMPYNSNAELVINSDELMGQYLFGIPVCNAEGRELTTQIIKQKILNAQAQIETALQIKLIDQIITESSDFRKSEFNKWGYVKVSFPVKKALGMDGWYNQIKQVSYNPEWLTSRKDQSSATGSDDAIYFRQIHLVPSGTTGNATNHGIVYNGVMPFALFLGMDYIPNYWHASYVTGFDKIPHELIEAVSKLAAVQLLAVLGDIYLGVGMSNYSISLDGLSQSTSLIKSGEYGIYGSRIKQYTTDLFGTDGKGGIMESLKSRYKGIIWDIC